jgi:putative ABC transport system substrate-binding protein
MKVPIGRRQFISTLGGTIVSWPLAARAQQVEQRMRRIGVLVGYAPNADNPVARPILQAFQDAMLDAGWNDGKNIHVDYRFAAGDVAKTNVAAADLVSLAPDVIYALGLPAARALQQKTATIPIVFTQVADPVGFGLVSSITHPGGNLTGFISWDLSIGGKWLELLEEIAPGLSRLGVIYNPDTGPYAAGVITSAKAAANSNVTVIDYPTRDDAATEAAVTSLASEPHGGLLVVPEPYTNSHQDQIISLAARYGLPSMLPFGGATRRGALISYTYATIPMIQQPVDYINRILKGASPGSLPVQAPTKFELSINSQTAKALRLVVPNTLLVSADEVIE